jgi:hypothetical protein
VRFDPATPIDVQAIKIYGSRAATVNRLCQQPKEELPKITSRSQSGGGIER